MAYSSTLSNEFLAAAVEACKVSFSLKFLLALSTSLSLLVIILVKASTSLILSCFSSAALASAETLCFFSASSYSYTFLSFYSNSVLTDYSLADDLPED